MKFPAPICINKIYNSVFRPLQFRHPVSEIELSAAFCYELQASGKSGPQRIPTSFDVPTSDGSLPKANQTIGLPLLRRTHVPISINECNRLSFVRCSFANHNGCDQDGTQGRPIDLQPYGETDIEEMKSLMKEDSCDLDTLKKEPKLEVTADEDKVLTDSNDSNVSSEDDFALEENVNFHNNPIYREKPTCELSVDLKRQCHSDGIVGSIHTGTGEGSVSSEQVSGISQSLNRHAKGKKSFKCDVCGKCFVESSNFRRHWLLHTGKKPFKCDVWKVFQTDRESEKAFSLTYRPKEFEMRDMWKVFLGVKRFEIAREKTFKCDICGKCFWEARDVKTHERMHTGDKPFKCDVCGLGFSQSGHLNRHARLHTGQRPFVCDVCGKSFLDKGDLGKHTRLHSDEEPFKCDVWKVSVLGEQLEGSCTPAYWPEALQVHCLWKGLLRVEECEEAFTSSHRRKAIRM
ncbi:hypothetical protein ANN_27636 [Periplaneta americana]|uniref:C2H2-type domain-containing protein n=1 Tax=Periplaneta americana TaxID=6978 RepID=A0ABQ8RWC2_PERAM|nr:hypothetical protein ANN_27636 [Periplaneta americana]